MDKNLKAIEVVLGIAPNLLASRTKESKIVMARIIYARLAREGGAILTAIGSVVGTESHSIVGYYLRRYNALKQRDMLFIEMEKQVREYLSTQKL